jgi:putative solute:sodium symporter small subunit
VRNALTEDHHPIERQRQQAYWRTTRGWTGVLVLAWLGSTLATVYWPVAWDFDFGGWPFGFWLAAQGVLLVFWGVVAVYAHVMSRADARWGHAADQEDDL